MKAKLGLTGNQLKMQLSEEAYQRIKIDADKAGMTVDAFLQEMINELGREMFPGKFPSKT